MTLFVEQVGTGRDLAMVHGWALHGGFWRRLGTDLARDHRVHLFDLPGHGCSGAAEFPNGLNALADMLVQQLPRPAIWIGWSLGGMVAMDVAIRYPEKVTKLVLLNSTPRFVQDSGWSPAMAEDVFAEFVTSLVADPRGTVMRFLTLQAGGDEAGRQLIKELRQQVSARGEPSPSALRNGLEILERADLRDGARKIVAPTLVIHGENDRIVPPGAGHWLATTIAGARFEGIPKAGHAPFISQSQRVVEIIEAFFK